MNRNERMNVWHLLKLLKKLSALTVDFLNLKVLLLKIFICIFLNKILFLQFLGRLGRTYQWTLELEKLQTCIADTFDKKVIDFPESQIQFVWTGCSKKNPDRPGISEIIHG